MRRKVAGAPSFAGPGRTILLIIQDASKRVEPRHQFWISFPAWWLSWPGGRVNLFQSFPLGLDVRSGIVIGCIETGVS